MSARHEAIHRLSIQWPEGVEPESDAANDYAMHAIHTFADTVGLPATFEVWYPTTTAADFDVLTIDAAHNVMPVLPYDEVEAARVRRLVAEEVGS